MTQTRIYLILASIILLYTALGFNSARVLYRLSTAFIKIKPVKFYSVFFFIFFGTTYAFFGYRFNGITINRYLIILAHYLFALIAYVMVITTAFSIIYIVLRAFKIVNSPISESVNSSAALIVYSLIIFLFIIGTLNNKIISTKSYSIDIDKKFGSESNLRIALFSDIHLGYINDISHMQKIVSKVNNLNPDIVLITGDIFDDDYYSIKSPEKMQKLFSSIKSKYGTYACLGNHDSGDSFDEMLKFLDKSNVKLLSDEKIVIDNSFILVGRNDPRPIGIKSGLRRPMPEIDSVLPVIVMEHRPSVLDEYGNNVDLILSGHTHSGQFFPFNLITRKIYDVDYGYFKKNDNSPQIIVTSGAGTWGPPLRVGTSNEVVEIVVRSK